MEKQDISSQFEKMTNTPVPRLIFTLAIPSIISMLVNNIYNLVDTAFVGRLGTSASGAVGIVFGFMAVIQAFGFMFGQGSGSILSRALGSKDTETASTSASSGFFGSTFFGIVIMIIGFIWLDDIVMILGSTDTIAPFAKVYISYILAAAPFMCGSLALNTYLRYEGKAFLGMVGLMSGAVLNMIGDPIFMFGLKMGIHGAGLSTAISQVMSFLILLGIFLSGRTSTKLSLKKALNAGISFYFNIFATGSPSLLRQGLNSLATVILNKQCAVYGDAAVAGMSIVSRIIFFAFSIALGVGQGFQPVCAFNYGAGRYSRIKKGFTFTCMLAEGIILIGCTLLLIFSGSLIAIFRDDPEVVYVGTRALRLQALAHLLLPITMITEMMYQSSGLKRGAALLSAIRSGLIFIPLLMILSKIRGLAGIQEAQPLSIAIAFPIGFLFLSAYYKMLPSKDKPAQTGEN
ncbi:MAG: MATE family efflux transporter [Lachnospiraceae bacterium]|nr:MATE family efflux transporter [Lachnospiraceae bacterium]